MILAILVIAAFCFFLAAVLAPKGQARTAWMGILGLILVLSALAIAFNDASHFGLTETTRTTTQRIVGVKGDRVIVKPVGTNGKNHVVAYRANPLSKKVSIVKPNTTTTVTVKRGAKAQLAITNRSLHYKNTFYAFLFAWSGQNHLSLHRTYTFTIPTSWQIVNH